MAPKIVEFWVLVLLSTFATHTRAYPTLAAIARQSKVNIQRQLQNVIGGTTEYRPKDTWDIKTPPDWCDIYFERTDGGNCYSSIICNQGGKLTYPAWHVCSVGGVQVFTDPRIGKFSIAFTKRYGTEGQGHSIAEPVLRLETLNWVEIDVTGYTSAYTRYIACKASAAGSESSCSHGPYISYWHVDNQSLKYMRRRDGLAAQHSRPSAIFSMVNPL